VPGLFFLRLGVSNAYLLRDEDGATLVDTGAPGSAPLIKAALEQLGVPR
jgi:glyoxylase-like metal-dependent hydrolase (beta-lactamase superfamily II)